MFTLDGLISRRNAVIAYCAHQPDYRMNGECLRLESNLHKKVCAFEKQHRKRERKIRGRGWCVCHPSASPFLGVDVPTKNRDVSIKTSICTDYWVHSETTNTVDTNTNWCAHNLTHNLKFVYFRRKLQDSYLRDASCEAFTRRESSINSHEYSIDSRISTVMNTQ